jgi:hypothetical protein
MRLCRIGPAGSKSLHNIRYWKLLRRQFTAWSLSQVNHPPEANENLGRAVLGSFGESRPRGGLSQVYLSIPANAIVLPFG